MNRKSLPPYDPETYVLKIGILADDKACIMKLITCLSSLGLMVRGFGSYEHPDIVYYYISVPSNVS